MKRQRDKRSNRGYEDSMCYQFMVRMRRFCEWRNWLAGTNKEEWGAEVSLSVGQESVYFIIKIKFILVEIISEWVENG